MSGKMQNRMKIALYVVLLLVSLLVQESVFGALNTRFSPCILPVTVMCIGLWEGMERGGIFGLVGGCLWAWSSELTMFGAWCIVILTVIGVAAGFMAERFLMQSWKTALCIGIPALFLTDGVLILYLSVQGTLPGSAVLSQFVPQCLISLIFGAAIYPVTEYISRIGGFHG